MILYDMWKNYKHHKKVKGQRVIGAGPTEKSGIVLPCHNKACMYHGPVATRLVIFKDNTYHLEAKCWRCSRHIQYLKDIPSHEFVMPFGTYSGKTLLEILREDRGYFEWCIGHLRGSPNIRHRMKEVLENYGDPVDVDLPDEAEDEPRGYLG